MGYGKRIDDVIFIFYPSPASYTGEDMVEIFSHGNPLIVRKILELLLSAGVRMAEPGEFSRRAFLNGKMDLTGAEAVNQLIMGKTEWEVSAALEQMHGSLRALIDGLREKIILLKADIEADIDFSDQNLDSIPSEALAEKAASTRDDIADILLRCRMGAKASAGFNVTIAGKPNVGKSSMMNLMLNEERAIVSDIPGTTRDIIRERVTVEGMQLNIHDTAGIGESGDAIERMGIARSRKSIAESQAVLVVVDALRGIDAEDRLVLDELKGKRYMVIINKTDAASEENISAIEKEIGRGIRFSAKTGAGLRELEKFLADIVKNEFTLPLANSFIADIRIVQLLESALAGMESVIELSGEQPEIMAFELQEVLNKLGEITGEISADDVLDSIFSRFCIGK
jgi:tRNA modification GTPase